MDYMILPNAIWHNGKLSEVLEQQSDIHLTGVFAGV